MRRNAPGINRSRNTHRPSSYAAPLRSLNKPGSMQTRSKARGSGAEWASHLISTLMFRARWGFIALRRQRPTRIATTIRIPREIPPFGIHARETSQIANSRNGALSRRILTAGAGSVGVQYLGWPLDFGPVKARAVSNGPPGYGLPRIARSGVGR